MWRYRSRLALLAKKTHGNGRVKAKHCVLFRWHSWSWKPKGCSLSKKMLLSLRRRLKPCSGCSSRYQWHALQSSMRMHSGRRQCVVSWQLLCASLPTDSMILTWAINSLHTLEDHCITARLHLQATEVKTLAVSRHPVAPLSTLQMRNSKGRHFCVLFHQRLVV